MNVMITPDLIALAHHGPAHGVGGETAVYGFMGASFIALLVFVTPPTFDTFNVVTSIEGFAQDWAIELAARAADAPAKPKGHH